MLVLISGEDVLLHENFINYFGRHFILVRFCLEKVGEDGFECGDKKLSVESELAEADEEELLIEEETCGSFL
jgi:hypothetical protein